MGHFVKLNNNHPHKLPQAQIDHISTFLCISSQVSFCVFFFIPPQKNLFNHTLNTIKFILNVWYGGQLLYSKRCMLIIIIQFYVLSSQKDIVFH